jgi:flavorubredoxin
MSEIEIINPRPVELAPDVFWLGECVAVHYKGQILHSGISIYLVAGDEHSAIIDAGITHIPVVMDQITKVLEERDLPPVRYLFVTHPEVPHSGGIGHLLERFPEAHAYGGVSDLHLVFPQFADRIHTCDPGDTLDLGGTELRVVESVFRDLPYTRWAFDTRRRVLFAGDGCSFSHEHHPRHCGHMTEDVPDLDIPGMMALFAIAAFNWVEYVDIEPYLKRLDDLVFEELDVELICQTHGLPIGDPRRTLPQVNEGLRRVSRSVTQGLL